MYAPIAEKLQNPSAHYQSIEEYVREVEDFKHAYLESPEVCLFSLPTATLLL